MVNAKVAKKFVAVAVTHLDTPEARGARAAFAIAGQRVRRKKKGIK